MSGYIDIAIDTATNDIAYSNGQAQYVINADEVLQRVRTCLRRIAGEWFLDTTAGVPYFNGQMLGGKDLEYVKLILRKEVLQIKGVGEILQLNAYINTTTKHVSVYIQLTIDKQIYELTEEIE